VGGVLFSVTLYALNQPAVYEPLGLQPLFRVAEPFLYFSVWAFLVALALIVSLSGLTKPEPADKTRYVLFPRLAGKQP
jgi:SSS family solute:Na+ symporter